MLQVVRVDAAAYCSRPCQLCRRADSHMQPWFCPRTATTVFFELVQPIANLPDTVPTQWPKLRGRPTAPVPKMSCRRFWVANPSRWQALFESMANAEPCETPLHSATRPGLQDWFCGRQIRQHAHPVAAMHHCYLVKRSQTFVWLIPTLMACPSFTEHTEVGRLSRQFSAVFRDLAGSGYAGPATAGVKTCCATRACASI